jgi:hypothetical protein
MGKKKASTAKSAMGIKDVPCLRVVVGGKPGKTGQADAKACAIVGESRGGVSKFELGKKYSSTSRTVTNPKKNKPCNSNRTGCPVQLAFENGQPFLRFCTAKGKAGYRLDVSTPAEANEKANAACATWKATGKFDFPAGTPLRGSQKTSSKKGTTR